MPEAPQTLTLAELLQAVAAEGLPLSRFQLDRWRKAGLLRTPDVVSLAEGHGKEAHYPRTAVAQLLTIAVLLRRSRDLEAARWQLFVDGFPVSTRKLKNFLAMELARPLYLREQLQTSSENDDDTKAEAILAPLQKLPPSRRTPPLVRVMRKRVPRSQRESWHLRLLQMAAGLYPRVGDEEDATLMSAGVLGDDAGTFQTPVLPMISELLEPTRLHAALREASEETLDAARAEFLQLIPRLRIALERAPQVRSVLALQIRRDVYWPDPFLFLLWLAWRAYPHARATIDAFLGIIEATP